MSSTNGTVRGVRGAVYGVKVKPGGRVRRRNLLQGYRAPQRQAFVQSSAQDDRCPAHPSRTSFRLMKEASAHDGSRPEDTGLRFGMREKHRIPPASSLAYSSLTALRSYGPKDSWQPRRWISRRSCPTTGRIALICCSATCSAPSTCAHAVHTVRAAPPAQTCVRPRIVRLNFG